MTKSVAVLGCGPAGLLVAHAAELSGWGFRIYSKKLKSPLYGAQYLHESITGLTGDNPDDGAVMLRYRLAGTPEEYRHKVYGPSWDGNTSPEDYLGEHLAWDIRQAYNTLWAKYADEIVPTEFERGGLATISGTGSLDSAMGKFDLVISTVPRTVWDHNEDNFEKSYIWALGDSDVRRVHLHRPPSFTVQCDGTKDHQWYRVSNIFGFSTMEWPQWWNDPFASVTPPARGASRVVKPLRYTGFAARDFIHLGRFAQWEKGVLTSDVFNQALKVFADDKIE